MNDLWNTKFSSIPSRPPATRVDGPTAPGHTFKKIDLPHFLAYMASALLLAMAVPRYRFVHVAFFYALVAGVLEAGQMYSPGRHPEVVTAVVSMAGAVMGEIVARLATGVWRKKYGFPGSFVSARLPSIPSEAPQPAAD